MATGEEVQVTAWQIGLILVILLFIVLLVVIVKSGVSGVIEWVAPLVGLLKLLRTIGGVA